MSHALSPGAFLGALLMWQAMMALMMLPVALPWVRTFAALSAPRVAASAGHPSHGAALPALYGTLFASGYALVWLGFSTAGALAQLALGGAHGAAPRADLLPALLLVAGAYQLSPAKTACLRHCRNPMSFFLSRWRNGPRGALGLGVTHGLFCLGCCWALMALALGFGVMSLGWMALLTAVVAIEGLAPGGAAFGRAVGWLALVVGGAGLALAAM